MIRALAIAIALCIPAFAGGAGRILLAAPWKEASSVVARAHVFAARNQRISLVLPPSLPMNTAARLYRAAGNTLVPMGDPISLAPGNDGAASIVIDFPEAKRPARYLLIFDLPEKQILEITAHPEKLLDPLRKAAKQHPLVVVQAPDGLAAVLEKLRIPAEFKDSPPDTAQEPVIIFQAQSPNHVAIKSPRIVLVRTGAPPEIADREIWIQTAPKHWKISVPRSYFHPDFLTAPVGQVTLLRLLTGDPNQP